MLSNKDIRIENGYIIINGEKHAIVDPGEVATLEERISGIEHSIVFGKWTPHIYDLSTKKREVAEQDYMKIGDLYIMFMDGTFDFSGVSTMIQIRNLPCETCVGGTSFLGSLNVASIGSVGYMIQGDGNIAYPRPNVVSDNFENATSAARTKFVFFGHD